MILKTTNKRRRSFILAIGFPECDCCVGVMCVCDRIKKIARVVNYYLLAVKKTAFGTTTIKHTCAVKKLFSLVKKSYPLNGGMTRAIVLSKIYGTVNFLHDSASLSKRDFFIARKQQAKAAASSALLFYYYAIFPKEL